MANATFQLECEDWVRRIWMPRQFGQRFDRERLRLSSGGVFDFDAVSEDRTIAACISTSGARTAGGRHGAGKLFKLRSDMLFLVLADVARRMVVLTEPDMYELCARERKAGRVPLSVEFVHAQLPPDYCERLKVARRASSQEVSPRAGESGPEAVDPVLREKVDQLTPSNDELLSLARDYPPPNSWVDEEDDPFTSEEGK